MHAIALGQRTFPWRHQSASQRFRARLPGGREDAQAAWKAALAVSIEIPRAARNRSAASGGTSEKKLSRMQEGTASRSAAIKLTRRSPSIGSGKGALIVERTQVSQSDGWGSAVIAIKVRFSCAKSDMRIMASMMLLSKGRREHDVRLPAR